MKKLVLALVAVSLASAAYAGAGCSGCTGEKSADKSTTQTAPVDGQKKA